MEKKQLYEKVIIKTEADLPKEAGFYTWGENNNFVNDKSFDSYTLWFNPLASTDIENMIEMCDWYLREVQGGQDSGQVGGQESKEPDQSDKKKGVWIRCTNCDGTGFEFKGKEQPTPQVSTKNPPRAEEILSEITGLSINYMFKMFPDKQVWSITPKTIIKAMEAHHQQRTREELIKFASYNFKEALRVDYDIKRIAEYVDDYLTK